MKKKKALVFGITGQDGSYLAELLLNKNYVVYGVKRRTSLIHTTRIDHIYKDFHLKTNLILKYGDVTDFSNVFRLINEIISEMPEIIDWANAVTTSGRCIDSYSGEL